MFFNAEIIVPYWLLILTTLMLFAIAGMFLFVMDRYVKLHAEWMEVTHELDMWRDGRKFFEEEGE